MSIRSLGIRASVVAAVAAASLGVAIPAGAAVTPHQESNEAPAELWERHGSYLTYNHCASEGEKRITEPRWDAYRCAGDDTYPGRYALYLRVAPV